MCFTKCYGTFVRSQKTLVREVKNGNQNFFLCHHRDCEKGLTLTGPKAIFVLLWIVNCSMFLLD